MALLNKPKEQQRKVDEWNALYPVGQMVVARFYGGATRSARTRAPAELLEGHSAVVWLDGILSACLLDRVTAVTEEKTHG